MSSRWDKGEDNGIERVTERYTLMSMSKIWLLSSSYMEHM